ncbi:phytanoyl-CoA dioxygenase family protein [Microbulbifer sp. CnH-101-G]|uniref:phytanoyl-CoA dioxygenase family protein n=1 Tax=Microbulbifer sp. CnH-101-G TaxID=3243393 RepID=UPI004039783E
MDDLECGHALIRNVLSGHQIKTLQTDLATISLTNGRGGVRNANKRFPSVDSLAKSEEILKLVETYLIKPVRLVRAIFFDKKIDNNWSVAWHQDKTVAVSSRFERHGWGPWSIKDGVHHVQPPLKVLKEMVTLRVHLDDAGADNGCLKVLPYSQREGILGAEAIKRYVPRGGVVHCEAKAGDILIMRPHILHSSDKVLTSGRRRIIHLEYSSFKLPYGASWV